ncbi:MAG: hypothetical protein JWO62_2588 [Acidimicrobiaceae bacterium]|nr:hypothetical protein [Acidimicrobiaceae bacterium]
MDFQLEALEEALRTLGSVLEQRVHPFGLLVVGGSSLLLLGLLDRPTGDLDVRSELVECLASMGVEVNNADL